MITYIKEVNEIDHDTTVKELCEQGAYVVVSYDKTHNLYRFYMDSCNQCILIIFTNSGVEAEIVACPSQSVYECIACADASVHICEIKMDVIVYY